MLQFDITQLANILVEEYNYSRFPITEKLKAFQKNAPEGLQDALNAWIKDRTILDEPNIDGITIQKIMERNQTHFFNALVSMGTILRDPSKAVIYHRPNPSMKR